MNVNVSRRVALLLTLCSLTLLFSAGCSPEDLLSFLPAKPSATPTPIIIIATATGVPTPAIEELDSSEKSVVNVYQRVAPSVVHITSQAVTLDFFFGAVPSEGTGSGFILDKLGHIVTNYHVVSDAESVEVTLSNDTKAPAKIIGVDPTNDLAVIRIDSLPDPLIPVTLGTSANLMVGQRAIAIGNPFGLDRTLTTGVISSLGRPLQTETDAVIYNVIQTDAAINPGNSGGPLLNSKGELIGVNTAIRSGAEGIGFAIPVDTIKRVIPELISHGRYRHPWLGALGYTIGQDLSKSLHLPVEKGILVARIYRNSPADKAGIHGGSDTVIIGNNRLVTGGDILVAVNSQALNSMDNLYQYLEEKTRVGDAITLHLLRDNKPLVLNTTLEEQPQ
jgi:S1-C subfamily serine protease